MSRFAQICLVALAVAVALACAGCGGAQHIDPPLYFQDSERASWLAAEAQARDIGGQVFRVLDTHSMEPLLRGGDYIVVEGAALASVAVGRPIVYRAEWAPDDFPPLVHRLVERDGHGGIVSGDNVRPQIGPDGRNLVGEARYRVTESNYVGVVAAIYRTL